MTDKIPTIKVVALFKSFTPDPRPYKPSTPVMEFPEPLRVVIEVPLSSDLVLNGTVIVAAQLSNQAEPKPDFTPLGMRYIIDQFEMAMSNGEHKETATSDDEEFVPTGKAKESSEDEWEDEVESTTDKDENQKWDEDWED
jgi:hypothetical protein